MTECLTDLASLTMFGKKLPQITNHRFRVANFIDLLVVLNKNNGFVVKESSDAVLRERFKDYFKMLSYAYHKNNLNLYVVLY